MMKITVSAILFAGMLAMPALAGLKFVATTNQPTYTPGDTGTVTLSVMVDPLNPGGSNDVLFVGGEGSNPAVFSFTGAGVLPTITANDPVDPFVNSLLGSGWQTPISVIPPAPAMPITVIPGTPVDVATFDFIYNALGTFNLEVNGLQTSDLNGPTSGVLSGAIPGATVTNIPEPSSFLFLGLVGTGVLGARMYRRRKATQAEESEADTETPA